MGKKDVENRHSETALFAAVCRAVAARDHCGEKIGSDEMAESFLPPHVRFFIGFESIRRRFVNKNKQMTPGAYEYLLARTAFFDRLFTHSLQSDTTQIVLLGAGYDSRACRFPKVTQANTVFELDVPTTQERKKRCMKGAGIDVPSNVKLLPINFNTDDIMSVLKDAGFDPEKKTLFLWEGVTMYLNPEAVAGTLASIHNTVKAGSLIAFDYIVKIPQVDMGDYYGVSKFMETWEKHRKEEPFRFTISGDGMASLLAEHGMNLVCHLDDREIHETYLPDKMGRVTGHFRFAVASNSPKDLAGSF